jgi:hypothetical protein
VDPARNEDRAAIGFRVRSGWAAAVLLRGSPDAPRVLRHRQVELCDPSEPATRQPYHAGFGLALSDSTQAQRLADAVRRWGEQAVAALVGEWRSETTNLDRAGLVVGSDIDPETIPNQHIRAHARERRLFRTTVEAALERADLPCRVVVVRDLYTIAEAELGRPEPHLKALLVALGRGLPGPWRAEEKMAAAVAWLSLAAGAGESSSPRDS